jgi:hypothetical protein
VKTWTSILAASAILALAAPAAYSATNGLEPMTGMTKIVKVDPASDLANVKLRNKTLTNRIKALIAKNRILAASNKSLVATNKSLRAQNSDFAAVLVDLRARLNVLLAAATPVPVQATEGTSTATPPIYRECVSLVDPDIVAIAPGDYDETC